MESVVILERWKWWNLAAVESSRQLRPTRLQSCELHHLRKRMEMNKSADFPVQRRAAKVLQVSGCKHRQKFAHTSDEDWESHGYLQSLLEEIGGMGGLVQHHEMRRAVRTTLDDSTRQRSDSMCNDENSSSTRQRSTAHARRRGLQNARRPTFAFPDAKAVAEAMRKMASQRCP